MPLSPQQQEAEAAFREFAAIAITPHAEAWDRGGTVPEDFLVRFAAEGYLAALVPAGYGGRYTDAVTFGLLNEAVGRACSSVRSLVTVHSMVVQAVARWGAAPLREKWLPALAAGDRIGAFALTEPEAGSDASSVAAVARRTPGGYALTGTKRWVTFGQRADVFLVFARCQDQPAAFLLPRDTPGLTVEPVDGMLGTRASLVAQLRLDDCHVPADALVGRAGFGISAVATSALDIGRYSVAWGCVGILRAALEISLEHAASRSQFGSALREHQLVQRMLADMSTSLTAARLLCLEAGRLKDLGDPRTVDATWSAKYFASCRAAEAAADTVQICGAAGCAPGHPAGRLFRDAKVMEIIEGSTQLQQIHLAQAAYHNFAHRQHKKGTR